MPLVDKMGSRRRERGLFLRGIGAVALVGLTVASAQSCPSPVCTRNGADGTCVNQDSKSFQCDPTYWANHIRTYPNKWYTLNNVTAIPPKPAIEYLRENLACCRHCAWGTGYPIAVEDMMAISPDQDFCLARSAPGKTSQCYLDCTQWASDFGVLDLNHDYKLNETEFSRYISDYFTAPPQLYKLYTGGQLHYNAHLSRLDPQVAFALVDLDNDLYVSNEEWQLFRHFIGPILVAKTGPQMSLEDGFSVANGPLGGLFMDQTLLNTWSTNQINIMLEYYLNNRGNGFQSSQVRELVEYEKVKGMQAMDLDGSERVSLEEHYFRLFADKDGDGYLNKTEYYNSIYRKTCAPLCPTSGCRCSRCPASGKVDADCGVLPPINGSRRAVVPADGGDGSDTHLNFDYHDMDQDGHISFLERKFVAADTDFSGTLTKHEWQTGDFPASYGPFEGHANCSDTDQTDLCKINRLRYTYYMAFHACALQGARSTNTDISGYPWSSSCPLLVQVQIQPPFIIGQNYETPADRAEWEARGYLCWGMDTHADYNICLSGYAIKVFNDIALRLQWTYRPVILRSDGTRTEGAAKDIALRSLEAPTVIGGAHRAVFGIGLFTSYNIPWSPPQYQSNDFRCSTSLWENDGLVIVKRTKIKNIRVEWAILLMFITPTFVNFIVFIYFLNVCVGHIFWLLERKANGRLFNPAYLQGVVDGSWFSIVTMSTVGYGDKVPKTHLGKMATSLWMFFGIISFGVLNGNVSSQIAMAALENSIHEPGDLSSFSVGMLSSLAAPKVQNVDLDKAFGFKAVLCKDLQECKEMLIDRESITAFIAPHADTLTYFNNSELNLMDCGNPLSIPGNAFTTDTTASFTGSTVKVCGYSRSVYASSYLSDAVSATYRDLEAEGIARKYKAEFLAQEQPNKDNPNCAKPSKYDTNTIIATVIIIIFYFLLIIFMRRRRKIAIQRMVLKHLMQAATHRECSLTPSECARKYGLRWLEKTRKKKKERMQAKLQELEQLGANDYLIHIAKRLLGMARQQTNEIRNIIHDTSTSRDRVSRLVAFMTWLGGFLSLLLLCLIIALLTVWSRIVRLTNL